MKTTTTINIQPNIGPNASGWTIYQDDVAIGGIKKSGAITISEATLDLSELTDLTNLVAETLLPKQ